MTDELALSLILESIQTRKLKPRFISFTNVPEQDEFVYAMQASNYHYQEMMDHEPWFETNAAKQPRLSSDDRSVGQEATASGRSILVLPPYLSLLPPSPQVSGSLPIVSKETEEANRVSVKRKR